MTSFKTGIALVFGIPLIIGIVMVAMSFSVYNNAQATAQSVIEHYPEINCTVGEIQGNPIPARGWFNLYFEYPQSEHNDTLVGATTTVSFNSRYTVDEFLTFIADCCTANSTHICWDGRASGDAVYFRQKPSYKTTETFQSKKRWSTFLKVVGGLIITAVVFFAFVFWLVVTVLNEH